MSFDNEMTGILFASASKEPGDSKPSYKGTCQIAGKKYEVAMWKKVSKKGVTFLSLQFQEPRQHSEPMNGADDDSF